MKQKLFFSIIAALWLLNANAQQARIMTPSEIFKAVVGSTVTITTDVSRGSGFYVAPNIIATNFHVMEGATRATARITNTNIEVEVIGFLAVNREVDLVLLQVTGNPQRPLSIANRNTSVGESIFVIGAPRGLEGSISDGIVSALRNRDGVFEAQISAPISSGSSGSPVVNQMGEVIGVATWTFVDGQNLNFATSRVHLQELMQEKSDSPARLSTLVPSVTIVNNTGFAVHSIHMSPTTDNFWGSDWLARDQVLHSGQSITLRLPHPVNVVNRYDIRLTDLDGDIYTRMNVLVGANSRIEFTFDDIDFPRITIVNNTGFTVHSIQINPHTDRYWSDNWLARGQVLRNGETITLRLRYWLGVTNRYHIRLTDLDGDTYTRMNVPVEANSRVEFTFANFDRRTQPQAVSQPPPRTTAPPAVRQPQQPSTTPRQQPPNLFRNLNAHFYEILPINLYATLINDGAFFVSATAFRYHNRFFNVGVLEIGTGTGLNLPNDISFWYWTWLDIGVGLPIVTARDRSWVLKTSGNISWRRSTYEELVSLGNRERTHAHTTRYDLRLDFLWRTPAISRIPLLRAYAKIDNQRHFTIGVSLNVLGMSILQWMY